MNALITEIIHLSAWLLLLCAVFVPLERLASVRHQAIFRPQIMTDIGYYALNSMLVGMLLSAPLIVAGATLHQVIPLQVAETINGWPGWVRLVLGLVVGEFGFYWGHRLTHSIPLLWRFHAIHHSAMNIDFLTNTRAHPVDMVFPRICGFVPVLGLGLTGTSTTVTALVLVVGTLWGFFIHANIRCRLGFLEHIITTPFFHHWHHANDPRRNGNYSAMFAFVDHIFGTYRSASAWPAAYGIEDPMPASLQLQLIHPFLTGPNTRRRPSIPR